jgi:antitoxin VapB
MALNIRNKEAERLAAELAKRTGDTKTEAVVKALREKLNRVLRQRPRRKLADDLEEIAERCARLPILDRRSPDQILGYDEHGLPR